MNFLSHPQLGQGSLIALNIEISRRASLESKTFRIKPFIRIFLLLNKIRDFHNPLSRQTASLSFYINRSPNICVTLNIIKGRIMQIIKLLDRKIASDNRQRLSWDRLEASMPFLTQQLANIVLVLPWNTLEHPQKRIS